VQDGGQLDVNVRLPGLAEGTLRVRKRGETFGSVGGSQSILLRHPALSPIASQVSTVLVVSVRESALSGWVGVGQPGRVRGSQRAIADALLRSASLLGCTAMANLTAPNVTNEFAEGHINLAIEGLGFRLGGFLDGTGSMRLDDHTLEVEGSARVEIPGGSGAELNVRRGRDGELGGSARLTVAFGPVAGTVVARLDRGFVHIQGTVGYSGERISGSLTLIATDERTARDLTTQRDTDPSQLPVAEPGPDNPPRPGRRGFCGWGDLTISLTPWLSGRARVLVNSRGQATIIGEITPQAELILFEEREWVRRIFRVEIRAGYGIPVVGQVYVFAAIGLEALARVGPGRLYNIRLDGTFSTDPRVANLFSIQASLNISAFAGLRLRAEGGVGITILAHDITAGVALTALAGIRGYVEATPRIGRREAANGRPEWFIGGHLEIAAQPFLGFGGELFVAIDAPWWSPVPDHRWTWPLFSLEYPLPGEFGIGADVDYVLGSRRWPTISFGEVEFDSTKFMTDLLHDDVPRGRGAEQRRPGSWREGTGGGRPGGARSGGGRGGRAAGQAAGFDGPIGEPMTFSDGEESHRLWIQESASDATPMVASQTERVEARLARWNGIPDEALRPTDRARAHFLKRNAPRLARALDRVADEQKALKTAEHNAAEANRRHGRSPRQRERGGRQSPDQVRRRVREAETRLKDMLRELATLMRDVPFAPIRRSARLQGGSEPIEVRDGGGHAQLHISGLPGIKALTDIQEAQPYLHAVNRSGRSLIDPLVSQLRQKAGLIAQARIRDARINRLWRHDLDAPLGFVVAAVGNLGHQMRIAHLARAKVALPLPRQTQLKFVCRPVPQRGTRFDQDYKRVFVEEMRRQLALQQRGLNALTVDRWLHNTALFRMDQRVFLRMDRDGRRAVLDDLRQRAEVALMRANSYVGRLQQRQTRLHGEAEAALAIENEYEGLSEFLRRQEEVLAPLHAVNVRIDQTSRRVRIIREAAHSIDAAIQADDRGETIPVPDRGVLDPIRSIQFAMEDGYATAAQVRRWGTRITGRQGNERNFRRRIIRYLDALTAVPRRPPRVNAQLPNLPEWTSAARFVGNIAVLHNPDQVAGGYDRFPAREELRPPGPVVLNSPEWKAYFNGLFDFIGLSVVNSQIGRQWDAVMSGAPERIQVSIPAVAQFINKLNFLLVLDPPNP
jgi:hypothetical protein